MPRARSPVAVASALAALLSIGALGCGGGNDGAGSGDEAGGTGAADAVAGAPAQAGSAGKAEAGGSRSVLDHTLPLLDGVPQSLRAYRGKVILVVNTASECGFTPQFGGLEALYRDRRGRGLVVLGFPADDVVGQEPRSDEEIASFCRANFGVTFPMFAKSNVVDDPVNPLFADLAAELGAPTYNFNKYLIDRRGQPVRRFDESTEPDDPELVAAIEAELGDR